MEKFRSMSSKEGRVQSEIQYGPKRGPTSMHDLRSYSTSYVQPPNRMDTVVKFKKAKGNSGTSSKNWSFNDPEAKRKKRVASYNVYAVEGKMKGSLRKSFKWVKDTCAHVIHGWS